MTTRTNRAILALVLLASLGSPQDSRAAVAEVTQTFELQPGWNTVFLEVRPENNTSESVFGGLPLASAWTWNPAGPKVEFVDDPTEQLAPSPQWLGYFPRPRPESILSNMFAVQANRAYLLKIEGTQPVVWTVTGVPEVKTTRWIPDAFNLVGFSVDPQQPPTFGNFLAPSPAHAGQPIYRLVGGHWEQITNLSATTIRSGEAYWVYCDGPSDYSGPIAIELESGKALEFGGGRETSRLRLRNLSTAPALLSLQQIPGSAPIPLTIMQFDPETVETSWPTLPMTYSQPLPQQGELLIDLSPDRAAFSQPEVGSVIVIKDGFGFQRMLAVTARSAFAPPPFAALREPGGAQRIGAAAATTVHPLAGLWVGNVSIAKVSQAQTGSLVPTPVGTPYTFRVILHVDAGGTTRLLKEVVELWQDGTRIPDPEHPGLFLVDEPGHYVLVANDSLISSFSGAVLRDGEPVGYRISTVAYDFDPLSLVMSGSFALSGNLQVSITLDAESPTNPFRHKYHPDHNNLDELNTQFRQEAFPVSRDMTFDFAATDTTGVWGGGFGSSAMGGTYTELISGLHRNDVALEGIFFLTRTSGSPELNQ